jgi:hypothetical protein
MPVMPQNEAGWRIEPPVSVPVLAAGSQARRHRAALPPDEPPGYGPCSGLSHRLRVRGR